jgi:hypothetical protein
MGVVCASNLVSCWGFLPGILQARSRGTGRQLRECRSCGARCATPEGEGVKVGRPDWCSTAAITWHVGPCWELALELTVTGAEGAYGWERHLATYSPENDVGRGSTRPCVRKFDYVACLMSYTNGMANSKEPSNPKPLSVFRTWKDLASALGQSWNHSGWIFRGQARADWELSTGLHRELAGHAPRNAFLANWENSAIGFFKRRARSQLSELPADDDIVGWLSLMQHYGAPTRLLDWTLSPYVACFFALSEGTADGEAAVWALNARGAALRHSGAFFQLSFDHLGTRKSVSDGPDGSKVVRVPALEKSEEESMNEWARWVIESEATWPLPIFPLSPDARMLAQQGLFTLSGDLQTPVCHLLDKALWREDDQRPGHWVEGAGFGVEMYENPIGVIHKFVLDRSMRSDALEALSYMGITADALFPGLDGIGSATRLHLQAGPGRVEDLIAGMFQE